MTESFDFTERKFVIVLANFFSIGFTSILKHISLSGKIRRMLKSTSYYIIIE